MNISYCLVGLCKPKLDPCGALRLGFARSAKGFDPQNFDYAQDDTIERKWWCNMYYVYILTNKTNHVMYIGVTNNLDRRLYEHKEEQVKGFTKKYHVHKLVYFEEYHEINDAITREKQLKGWSRAKKNLLVETENPNWNDLSAEFI